MNTYEVTYERDDNDTWFVTADDVPGAHSYGRTIGSARDRIREAIALVLDIEPDGFEINEHVSLSDSAVEEAFAAAGETRRRAEAARAAAREATGRALGLFDESDLDLGLRDVAELLGLSHQRVQQLLSDIRAKAQINHG